MVVLAAVMIVLGLFGVVRVYGNYRSDMLTYESRHLSSIVSSGARSIGWMLDGYAALTEQLPTRREFNRAEQEYLSSGNVNILWALMSRRDIFWPNLPGVLAVCDEDGKPLAVSDAAFPSNTGEDEYFSDTFSVRQDTDGGFWFIFRSTSSNGLKYELAASIDAVFQNISEATNVGREGYLFMLDTEGVFVSYSNGKNMGTCSTDELLERFAGLDSSMLTELYAREKNLPGEYYVFRYPWSAFSGYGSYETLVVTGPVMQTNARVLIGAAMSFQEFDSLLADTLWEITVVFLLILGGVALLLFLSARISVLNRQNRLELETVRERMELMEEISRQQQSLAHTERLQQLGVMTSGIVHEFNNLLTPIMGNSMLLLEQLAESPDTREFESALDIYEAAENARGMLKRMSGMGKKDVDMAFQTLDICTLLRKTMTLASLAKDPHIQQELILPEEPLYVSGNDQLLTQAILNLCINACQAMGSEGTLTVEAASDVRAGRGYVTVTISDTGPGIPEERMGSIYEPFFTTKGERGTGLGLAICKKIIETHKGTIQAANRKTGGAVFTVRIPTCEQPGEL